MVKYALSGIPSAMDTNIHEKYIMVSPKDPADTNLYIYSYGLITDGVAPPAVQQPIITRVRPNPKVEVAFISHTVKMDLYAAVEETPGVGKYKLSDGTVIDRYVISQISGLKCTMYSSGIRMSFYAILTTNSDKIVIFNYENGINARLIDTKIQDTVISAMEMTEWRRLVVAGGN